MPASAWPRTTQASFHARLATSRRAGDQALAGKRRGDVRGVPGEETAPLGEGLRLARVEAVDRGALDADVIDVAPGREQASTDSGRSIASRILARVQHELPALPAARGHHVRRRPARIADELDVVDRVRHVHRVDDQPVLREGAALELEAEQAAHERVRAVGADQEARPRLPLAALGVLQPGVDEVAVVDKPLERDAEAHVDAGMAGDLRAQHSLELGLVEGHQHRVAVDDAGRADAREAAEQRRVVLHLRDRDGRELAVAHADHLQDAQGLVVERDGARLGEDLGGLVDRQHRTP